ncbi:hypothetical protein VNI00_009753 [Paramarasmius palmivorus]|uniref:Uncharacterized protein n=1 Tax=Paramarasmius palmivorus TaxID=297713 RepID=A0AAW0CNS5_9AGAR
MNPLVNYCFQERHLPPEPPHLDRIDAARVRYYLIDYGYSIKFPSRTERFQVINSGAQIRLAEFYEKDKPFGERGYALHDPFKADVKQLGVLVEMLFGFSVPFLLPLFRAIDLPPQERPDAPAALAMFKQLTQNLSRPQLLRPKLSC